MTNPFAAFGGQMLTQLGMNLSNRIGTGRSLRRQMSHEQVEQTRKEASAGIIGRVEGAKAAGLHPLVAMGSNVGGATLPTGGSFNAVDPGFGQIMMHNREMKMRDEELEYQKSLESTRAKQAQEAAALQNRAAEAEIKLREAQTARELKAIADSDRDFAASQAALARQQPVVGVSRPVREKPLYTRVWAVDPVTKKGGWFMNPDLGDVEYGSAVTLPSTANYYRMQIPELSVPVPVTGKWPKNIEEEVNPYQFLPDVIGKPLWRWQRNR